MQVAGQRQLHKADPLEQGYTVVGFGSHCVPKMLSLALAMHDAAAALSSKAAAAGGGVRWRLRIGIAKGSVVMGGMGSSRQRCHFFGEAVAEAVRLARECDGGETRVQRGVSKAEGSQTFVFQRLPCPPAPSAPAAAAKGSGVALALRGRRTSLLELGGLAFAAAAGPEGRRHSGHRAPGGPSAAP